MQILQKITHMDKRQKIRYAVMVLSILALAPPVGFLVQALGGSMTCGVVCLRMAIGSGFMRSLFSQTLGVVVLFAWLGITFFFGRWMCSHVCPSGALTEFGSKLLPRSWKLDYARHVDVPLFRYGFFAGYLALPLVGFASLCCSYCNMSTIPEAFGALFNPQLAAGLLTGSKAISVILYVFAFGIIARDGRGHCHLLCPIGAVDALVSALGAKVPFTWRVRVASEQCSGCGACAKSCPASAITVNPDTKQASINYYRCYQCRICEGHCTKQAIHLARGQKAKQLEVANEATAAD